MEIGEIVQELHILVDKVETDIDHCAYENMRGEMRAAVAFLDTKLKRHDINPQEYNSMVDYLKTRIFLALVTE